MEDSGPAVAESGALGNPSAEVAGTGDLPASVQRRLVSWAAESLTALPLDRVPGALRRVARFAPAKRARSGFTPLLTALDADQAFRAHVSEFARNARHEMNQSRATTDDVVESTAEAFLLRLPGLAALLAQVGSVDLVESLQRRVQELTVELERAGAARAVAQTQLELLSAQRKVARPSPAADADLEKLRGRLREQGTTIRELKDQLERESTVAAGESELLKRDLARSRAEVKALQERLDAARIRGDRAAAALQEVASETTAGQAGVDRKVDLLLQTLEEGVAGLRTQLHLRNGGLDPADTVADQLPMTVRNQSRPADPALLYEWLTLPRAHLVVDGYNISKTGYPALTLADQRERLVRELAAVAARTSCEVTVVFDGAAVVAPQSRVRGVRVIFSPPGVIADEVIRRLVVAEPIGRVLVVATADKEILDSVLHNGARTVAPLVLLTLMSP